MLPTSGASHHFYQSAMPVCVSFALELASLSALSCLTTFSWPLLTLLCIARAHHSALWPSWLVNNEPVLCVTFPLRPSIASMHTLLRGCL